MMPWTYVALPADFAILIGIFFPATYPPAPSRHAITVVNAFSVGDGRCARGDGHIAAGRPAVDCLHHGDGPVLRKRRQLADG